MIRYTYEVAPVFTLMEQEVMSNLIKIIGYENGDGLFCPGMDMQVVEHLQR